MNPDELRAYLTQNSIDFTERAIEHGAQFRCKSGEIFNVYETGTLSLQGKTETSLARAVQEIEGGSSGPSLGTPVVMSGSRVSAGGINKQIFIVYGHDTAARESLELLLHRMDLEPIILQKLPAAGDTIIEKLEGYIGEHGNVGFACVLLTPDDQGYEAGKEEQKMYRARQNVILELGMVLARLGRSKVAILHKESVELPSDIAGLIYIPFTERIDEVTLKLLQELEAAGYQPKSQGL